MRYTRDNPHPTAVEATHHPDRFEEVAEVRFDDENGSFGGYRFGRLTSDRPWYGWAVVVWLYEDYTGDVELIGPYARVNEMRRVMREEIPAYFAEQDAQHASEIAAEMAAPQHLVW